MSDNVNTTGLLGLTAQIVSAHIRNNKVATEALSPLIQAVYQSLSTVGTVEAEPEKLAPAVPWKKSVFSDFIICLEDGKKLKMLKRHLKTSYGLTPEQYRSKWGLPKEYPMVAPTYANRRSELAKLAGLGRKLPDSDAEPVPEPEPEPEPEAAIVPARRGKRAKA